MTIAKILGKAGIPIMSQAETDLWIAETPLLDEVVYNTELPGFCVSDGFGAYANFGSFAVLKDDSNPNTAAATHTWIAGKNILLLLHNQVPLRVVNVAPTDATEVRYNVTTGVLTLFTGQTFAGQWLSILYDNNVTV